MSRVFRRLRPPAKPPPATAEVPNEHYTSVRINREPTQLFERGLRLEVVAVYHRSQAHRTALSVLHHGLLLRRRRIRRRHALEPADAGRHLLSRHLQQAVHHARDHHGVLLPGPVDSRDSGQFSGAADDRRARSGVPANQSIELVYLHRSAASLRSPRSSRRRGYRLDFLCALQLDLFEYARDPGRARRLRLRLFVDSHRPELHRHDPHDARAGHDLGSSAAVHVGALCHQLDPGAGHAGHRDHHGACWAWNEYFTPASSIRPSAAIRSCFSICSGSTRTRPCTS